MLAAIVDRTVQECEVRRHQIIREGSFRHQMIDFINMTERIRGFRYILVVGEKFSRCEEAVPIKKVRTVSQSKVSV